MLHCSKINKWRLVSALCILGKHSNKKSQADDVVDDDDEADITVIFHYLVHQASSSLGPQCLQSLTCICMTLKDASLEHRWKIPASQKENDSKIIALPPTCANLLLHGL